MLLRRVPAEGQELSDGGPNVQCEPRMVPVLAGSRGENKRRCAELRGWQGSPEEVLVRRAQEGVVEGRLNRLEEHAQTPVLYRRLISSGPDQTRLDQNRPATSLQTGPDHQLGSARLG